MLTRFPALRSREFRIFLAGQLISLIGTWMQMTIQPYLAYQLTGQPIYLGLIGFAGSLPTLFITLPAGVLIERVDRRKVVIVMQAVMMLQAFALAFLTISGLLQIWHIVALALILGVANAIEIPARQSMLYELVGREGLASAIGLQSTVFNTARILGPGLSAPFFVFLSGSGEGWAFVANGFSFLVVIAGLLVIRPRFAAARRQTDESAFQQLRAGQKYVLGTPVIALLVMGVSVMSVIGFPNMQQVPAFAKDVLGTPGDTIADVAARNSAMLTIQGVGALIAAITVSLSGQVKRKGIMLFVGQVAGACALIGLALSRSLPLSLACMAVFGWGTITAWATTNTVIQLITPTELRSRVISNMLWASQGIAPFGSLLVGALAQQFGTPAVPALVGGVICLLVPLIVNFVNPAVRRIEL